MEKQKSIIVLHQKKEKANGEPADGLRNMGDIRKGSVCQNVKKLETGESIVAKGSKARWERNIEKGERRRSRGRCRRDKQVLLGIMGGVRQQHY